MESENDLVGRFYRDYYKQVFNTEGFVGWSYRKTHRAVESGHPGRPGMQILEIGAGTGEHLSFVDPSFARYVMADLFPEPADVPWQGDSRIEWLVGDVCSPILEGQEFDRVVSMCVLHHLNDPSAAMDNIKRWLKPGGTFTVFLPSDPGLLNRVNRAMFVTPRARKLGFDDYEVVNAREHHNHYWGLRREMLFQFQGYRIKRRYFPFGLPFADASVYSVWNITKPLNGSA
ncbi:MAG: class I SAM-dependent methyltransferase [Actinomycetota bacterium]|nr:class I SAM-dependent methyltransferase [Actinomycetota bacterium]MDP2287450.1 class I SAM-dependent methyltransferase [Actinomycetota bacterium]